MIDAEDILTLPSESSLELLPELLLDSAEPVTEYVQFGEADFGEDDVLSLADALPVLRLLPQPLEFQMPEPLRCTEPLSSFTALANAASPDSFGLRRNSESADQSENNLRSSFTLTAAEQLEQSSLAAELAARLAAVDSPAEPLVEAEKHVVFTLAGAKYAVPMDQVLEVCDFDRITPVINVPEWVMGITNLRGDIISVVDLRHFLTSSTTAAMRRESLRNLVVVQTQRGDLTTCLVVESMLGMAQAPTAEIQKVERVLGDGLTPYTRGFFAQDDELLSMLNLESLLRSLEISG
jgi:purine-binding chemotaxis protein CheW